MIQTSAEQLKIIGSPIAPISVIACAGSGKTHTAVRRLMEIRRHLGGHRGRVLLLSFSNVAVDTFRREYKHLMQGAPANIGNERVEIDTLDGFISSNVLRPHAYRTMGCDRAPFLIAGSESFLQNRDFKFWAEPARSPAFPVSPTDLHKVAVNFLRGQPTFHLLLPNGAPIPINNGLVVTSRLGALGAYTHELGRYWCYSALARQPGILRALARRYPHILIDEAQDIGTIHQAIIEQLISAGSQVSLIGDPNQGIYEFAGADGSFLTRYGHQVGVKNLGLTRNYRSVPAIVDLANRLSARTDTAARVAPSTTHGAFFIPYRNADHENLVTAFEAAVVAADLKLEQSAVLCRGRDMVNRLAGNQSAPGQGTVRGLAQAAILRDHKRDLLGAYKLTASCVIGLLADPPQGLFARITQPTHYPDERPLRRLIWAFARNPDSGIPAASLSADRQWHPQLLKRTKVLLASIERNHGLRSVANLGRKLAKKDLTDAPLIAAMDLAPENSPPRIRIDTVHQAKGESLDAVLYMANREQVNAMLAGVNTEAGRIGYVAVTRARNLLWLGVPANALKDLRPALLAHGFQEGT